MARWYHGTSERKKKLILQSWFKPKKGIWGKGVYFSSSKEGASIFGPCILATQIADADIVPINYDEWVSKHPDQATWPKEVQNLEGKAISVHYHDSNETELCVLDPEIIKQIFY
ncbi:hypothetical protein [Paenibacillus taichungensis]